MSTTSFNKENSRGGVGSGSGGKPSSTRPSFLRTKRVLVTLSLLIVAAIILIVLGATGTFATSKGGSQPAENQPAGNAAVTAPKPPSVPPEKHEISGSIANGTALRIMALGASTVRGQNSPGNVGFRKPLRDALVALNVPVNMVGSQKFGDMKDNDVEAYPGVRVSQIHERSKKAVEQYKPNVFLINAGINNALMLWELETAGQDMEKFIRYLLATSPRAFVVLSTLTTSKIPNCEPLILDMNQQYWDLYAKLESEKLPIVIGDMHHAGQDPDAIQPSDITSDGTHPTVKGYAQMARIFLKAIQRADSLGFLKIPVPLDGVPDDGAAPNNGAPSSPKEARFITAHEGRRRFMLMKRELCTTPNPNLWN